MIEHYFSAKIRSGTTVNATIVTDDIEIPYAHEKSLLRKPSTLSNEYITSQ